MAIHKFTRKIDRGETIPLYGDGSSERDYTYISDIIQGVMGAIERVSGYEIVNLGESRTVSLKELIERIEASLGKQARIQRLPEQPGDVRKTCADIGRARTRYGYNPQVPIEQGIPRFVEWYRSQARDLAV